MKIRRRVRNGCCLSPIVFNFYSECLPKEVLEGFEDFKIGEQILLNVKYGGELVLLAEEEMVLQGTIERLIDVRRCYGTEMNMGMKTEVKRISRQPPLIRIMIGHKKPENVKYFKYFGYHDNK